MKDPLSMTRRDALAALSAVGVAGLGPANVFAQETMPRRPVPTTGEMLPVVFVDAPGGSYWKEWEEYVRGHLHDTGMISEADLALFRVTDDAEEAVGEILGFYRNYHSSRYVGDKLVIRLCHSLSEEQLDTLNTEFADVLASGAIEATEPIGRESEEVPGLPRIALRFDRHSIGRLRQMVDRMNEFVAEPEAVADAAPHEIVELPLSEDAERRRDEL